MKADFQPEKLLNCNPYTLPEEEKQTIFLDHLNNLTTHHYSHCQQYKNIVDNIFGGPKSLNFSNIYDAPFLPARLFKVRQLKSIADDQIYNIDLHSLD